MLGAEIETPVPLEELEIHLREEIERQVQSGLGGQPAFEISVQQIGQPKSLKSEFKKIERTSMKQIFKIAAAFLLGVAIQLPGSLQLRDALVMADGRLGLWLLGFILQMWAVSPLWRTVRPGVAKIEFEKFELSFPQLAKTSAGVVVLLTGVALAIPAALQASRAGSVKFDALCWLAFGFALLVLGALVTFCPYKSGTHNSLCSISNKPLRNGSDKCSPPELKRPCRWMNWKFICVKRLSGRCNRD